MSTGEFERAIDGDGELVEDGFELGGDNGGKFRGQRWCLHGEGEVGVDGLGIGGVDAAVEGGGP